MKILAGKLNIISFCFVLFVTFSCGGGSSDSHSRSSTGKGTVVEHEIPVEIFKEIKVEGAIDVVYESKPDEAAYLRVEAEDDIIPLVDIKVKKNTLNIKAKESINPARFVVYTNSPSLEKVECKGASNIELNGTLQGKELKVEMRGTGNLTAENLIYEKAEFKLEGAGDMTMAGQVQKAKLEIGGTGNINALGLITDDLECKIRGAGNMEVNAVNKMSIEIGGSGNISYKGNPQITKQKIKGAGTVKVVK